jgi:hypothetical protein
LTCRLARQLTQAYRSLPNNVQRDERLKEVPSASDEPRGTYPALNAPELKALELKALDRDARHSVHRVENRDVTCGTKGSVSARDI